MLLAKLHMQFVRSNFKSNISVMWLVNMAHHLSIFRFCISNELGAKPVFTTINEIESVTW